MTFNIALDNFQALIKNSDPPKYLIKDINVDVKAGEILVIIGSTGSGKSTLLKAISLNHDLNVSLGGNIVMKLDDEVKPILCDGKSTTDLNWLNYKLRLQYIGHIFQESYSSFNPRYTVENHFLNKLKNLDMTLGRETDIQDVKEKAKKILGELGIKSLWEKYPTKLSGGQQQKIDIALALLNRPKLILADEPFQNLDPDSRSTVVSVLSRRVEMGAAAIIITHNLDIIRELGEMGLEGKVCIMEKKDDDCGCFFNTPARIKRFFTSFNNGADEFINDYKRKTDDAYTVFNDKVSIPKEEATPKSTISIEDLNYRNDYKSILKIDNFNIPLGQVVAIVGSNGAGKSTLLKALAGIEMYYSIYRETDDQIKYYIPQSDSNTGFEAKMLFKDNTIRRKVQIVFQESSDSLDPVRNPEIFLQQPRINFFRESKAVRDEKIHEVMKYVEYPDFLDEKKMGKTKDAPDYSPGQVQRICLARALLCQPEVLLLDEPLSSLDIKVQKFLLNTLFNLENLGKFYNSIGTAQIKYSPSIIYITHDLLTAVSKSDYLILMEDGEIIEGNTTQEIIRNPRHEKTIKIIEDLKKNIISRLSVREDNNEKNENG